jgi:transcriptional antiterminator NusG
MSMMEDDRSPTPDESASVVPESGIDPALEDAARPEGDVDTEGQQAASPAESAGAEELNVATAGQDAFDSEPAAGDEPAGEPSADTEAMEDEAIVDLEAAVEASASETVVDTPAAAPAPEREFDIARAAASWAEEARLDQAQEALGAAASAPAVEETQEPAEAAEPEGPDDDRRWYVVHCYSGYENKVRHNLEQRIESMGMKSRIFDVVVPTEEELEVRDGKRRTVERRVFPGYILVQMIMSEESWYVVRNTPGVTGFVGMGNDPTPLRPEEVASIVKRMEAEAPRVKVTYKAGQKVRIIDGPFNDFIGTVDAIDMERAKVRVMVSFFGRETPVELDFLQVEKA